MNAQSAKTLTPRESVTITLTPQEYDLLLAMFYRFSSLMGATDFSKRFYNKLKFLNPNIGDACATPAHIPEAPGQGGTISCTDLPDCRCSECLDFLKREYDATEGQFCFVCSCDPCVCGPDPVGQGGNQ